MSEILIITGNTGRDPEMRYTPSGQPVCNFSVASTRSWKNGAGEKVKETTWFKVATWGKLAEVCSQYVKKGMKVQVQGRLVADPVSGGPKLYSRQDGTQGASFEVTASSVEFLSGGNGSGESSAETPEGGEAPASDNEIPF